MLAGVSLRRPGKMGPLARRLVAVLMAAAAVVVAAVAPAAGAPTTDGSGAGKPMVGVVGDSITFLIQPALSAALAPTYSYEINGYPGRTIAQQYPVLETMLRDPPRPRAMIVNLGTNDALRDNVGWPRSFVRQVNALRSTSCVILVNIDQGLDKLFGNRIANRINAAIARTVARHRNFHEIDWNAVLAAHPRRGLLMADHIHPSPAGQRVLVRLYLRALRTDCRR